MRQLILLFDGQSIIFGEKMPSRTTLLLSSDGYLRFQQLVVCEQNEQLRHCKCRIPNLVTYACIGGQLCGQGYCGMEDIFFPGKTKHTNRNKIFFTCSVARTFYQFGVPILKLINKQQNVINVLHQLT